VSWIWLRGRASCCGCKISIRYPLVEALTAVLFGYLWTHSPYGPALIDGEIDVDGLWAFLLFAFFVSNLVANSFIDIDHRILPNVLTKSAMLVGLGGSLVAPGLAGRFEIVGLPPAPSSFLFSMAGLLVGFGLTQAVRKMAQALFLKDAMGFGDVKLMAAIGAFLGWKRVLLTFFVGCVLGAVVGVVHRWRTKDTYICFGPFLAAGALITLFAGDLMFDAFAELQNWQRASANAPWIVSLGAAASVVLLIVLVRRGRAS
jgi:leader peptidase (prepilin peptidase)/N-methyltransferase